MKDFFVDRIFYFRRFSRAAVLLVVWCLSLFSGSVAFGQSRSFDEICDIALSATRQHFGGGRAVRQSARDVVLTACSEVVSATESRAGREAFYVCTIGDVSQVIVSGDERMPEVLGFTERPVRCFDSLPAGYRYLLEVYARDYVLLCDSGYAALRVPYEASGRRTVGPLLRTQWGQNEPYNNTCPMYSGQRALTGCVATAMAQIMNYYRYPDDGRFDWDNMPADCYYYSAAQADAVSALMRSCGSAVRMQYGTSSSYAYHDDAYSALMGTFGFPATMAHLEAADASSESWRKLLREEIDKGHPIYYGGANSSNYGHAFVIDGYQTDDVAGSNTYFHINYGWDGDCDGYYVLGNLQGYNYQQEAILNIRTEANALARDGGIYQAGSLVFTPRVMTRGDSHYVTLRLDRAVFNRGASLSDSKMRGYLVHTATGEKYQFASWDLGGVSNHSLKNPVCRNSSFYVSNSMPLGRYEVVFYSSNDGSDENLVTISSLPVYVEIKDGKTSLQYVDLGLPSGTLWANQNVGATCEEDCGNYYAWGETSIKRTAYLESNNKYYDGSKWTKYCTISTYGTVDNLSQLEASDDAASVVCGKDWVTPTYDQFRELKSQCTWSFTEQSGIKGYRVTGKNGHSIFLPFTGLIGETIQDETSKGDYWSTTLGNNNRGAYILSLTNSDITTSNIGYRGWGRTVRPVFRTPKIYVSSLTLSATRLDLFTDNNYYLQPTVLPANAFEKTLEWSSSNEQVATVTSLGYVKAVGSGTAVITARTTDGSNLSATCVVTVTVPVTSVAISHAEMRVAKGATCRLLAASMPANASRRAVTLTSSDSSVLTVSDEGDITGVGYGSAYVSAQSVDNPAITARCLVTVVASPGDVDADGTVTLADVSALADCLLSDDAGSRYPDVNTDTRSSIADMTTLIGALGGHEVAFHQCPAGRVTYYPPLKSDIEGQDDGYFYKNVTINYEAGDVVAFDWRVSSEDGCDYASIEVNHSTWVYTSGRKSGSFSQQYSSAGTLTITLRYSKDESVNSGEDCVCIDNLRVVSQQELSETTAYRTSFPDWTSDNAGHDSTSSEITYSIRHTAGQKLQFDWSVSSEYDYDFLYIYINEECVLCVSGSNDGSFSYPFTSAGTSTLRCVYVKDSSDSEGRDQGRVYNIRLTSD